MTPLRFSMLTATLLAFAATVHGQAPPEPACPFAGMPTWAAPYLQQSMQTWQQVRGFCTGQTCAAGVCGSVAVGSPGCCKLGVCVTGAAGCVKCCETTQAPASCCCAKACACCESCKAKKDEAAKVQQTRTGSLMLGAGVNCDNGVCAGIVLNERNFDGIAIQQAKRDLKMAEFYLRTGHPGAAQFYYEMAMRRYGPVVPPMVMPEPHQMMHVQAMPMPPMLDFGFQPAPGMGPMAFALPFGYPSAPPMPVPPPPPMAHQVVQVQAIPAPPMYALPQSGVLIPDLNIPVCGSCQSSATVQVAAAPALKHAHLVTPDLEAHCTRMTHRGDTIILEGDVILLNKKHAQPIRIEAQRAVINMKDGTITVDGPGSNSNFGVTRTSAVMPVVERVQVEERRVQVIRLRNAQAYDVAEAISKLQQNLTIANNDERCRGANSVILQRDAAVSAEPASNSVLISATPRCFDVLVRIIAELDTSTKVQSAAPPVIAPYGVGVGP
jgi:hypothetical protein